jgi:hypothetical protein
MPLFDVVCNAGAVAFWHKDPIGLNVGVEVAFTVTGKENGPAHCPAFGVKVYVDVPVKAVFITAGLHVPLMPLFDVVCNTGAVEF